jgi:hypothetical protein
MQRINVHEAPASPSARMSMSMSMSLSASDHSRTPAQSLPSPRAAFDQSQAHASHAHVPRLNLDPARVQGHPITSPRMSLSLDTRPLTAATQHSPRATFMTPDYPRNGASVTSPYDGQIPIPARTDQSPYGGYGNGGNVISVFHANLQVRVGVCM